MREVCFCEETHFSFIYTLYIYVLLAGPKEPKDHGRVKIHGRGPGGSARRTGNSPSRAQTPRCYAALPPPPPPDFHNAPAIRIPPPLPNPLSLLLYYISYYYIIYLNYIIYRPIYRLIYSPIPFIYLPSTVGTRRGASASTFQMKKVSRRFRRYADFPQISRRLMRRISGKVSQITQITQIAIRQESMESILICGIR